MRLFLSHVATVLGTATLVLLPTNPANAALLAYEPFTNATGTAIIGSGDGSGFSGTWQANSSAGVATNTSFGLTYADGSGNVLTTSGGAGFFQGSTSASTAMQPVRLFNFSRGTNSGGTDGVTTWISFLIVRQGPSNGSVTNAYLRGANIAHDLNGSAGSGVNQKLSVGNGSGASTNTVSLLPYGQVANIRPSAVQFGIFTNLVIVRIDHVPGANDNAYLFVNPSMDVEPLIGSANTNSLGGFDYSIDRIRVFSGGNSSAAQPYAELLVDEYRIGDTFADVTPHTGSAPPAPLGPIIITNTTLSAGNVILSGIGGNSNGTYRVLNGSDIAVPSTNWPSVATNTFDSAGNFSWTNPSTPGIANFYRVVAGAPQGGGGGGIAPNITNQPVSLVVTQGNNALFSVLAGGSAPLLYQWFFNTNTLLLNATNTSLTVTNVQPLDAGGYSVRVANGYGSVTSILAFLTVTNPPLAPSITTQPTNMTVLASNNATFTVVATGTAPLRYQWFFNTNTLLNDFTNASLTITNATTNNAGGYSVIVTNSYGSKTSSVATLTIAGGLVSGAFFVSPSGNDSNPGSQASPFLTISRGLTAIANNGVLYLRGGVYVPPKLNLNRTTATSNLSIRVWAYPGETPIIDGTNNSDGVSISGRWYHLKGLTVQLSGHNGINISGHSNLVENCVTRSNINTGLHITGGEGDGKFPSYNLILNCDSYRNFDPPAGGNADGFSAKWDMGPGNVFRGCRAWENSDDGWDLWMATSPILIDSCWAFGHGFNWWNDPGYNGNGNGFKIGGNYVGTEHRVVHSVAFSNHLHGIDQNNNTAGQIIDNNTCWENDRKNFNLDHNSNNQPMTGVHVLRNNLSISGGEADAWRTGSLLTNNNWQVISPAANNSDLQSVDPSVAKAPRNADGSLPTWPFLRPVTNGRLIDQGVNVGDPYSGTAPDLGAFEVTP